MQIKKLTKMEREARHMARQIFRENKFKGLIYVGGSRKGQFYVPVDRSAIRQKGIQYWGDDVTTVKLSRMISLLRGACRLEGLLDTEKARYRTILKRIDNLLME